jgi:hypothetical protein
VNEFSKNLESQVPASVSHLGLFGLLGGNPEGLYGK